MEARERAKYIPSEEERAKAAAEAADIMAQAKAATAAHRAERELLAAKEARQDKRQARLDRQKHKAWMKQISAAAATRRKQKEEEAAKKALIKSNEH